MEQKVALCHPGAGVFTRAAGADLAQLTALRVSFRFHRQNARATITRLDNGAGGPVAENKRRLLMLPVDPARGDIRRHNGDTAISAVR